MKPSDLIDKRIVELSNPPGSELSWRGEMFAKLRNIILSVEPEIVEEWKWDTGVWTCDGLLCAIGAFKDSVKLNFFQGAALPDSKKLFNAGLEAKKTRAIDFHKGDDINDTALRDLIQAAVNFNRAR